MGNLLISVMNGIKSGVIPNVISKDVYGNGICSC